MGCIETEFRSRSSSMAFKINFNMGCIETKSIEPQKYYILRLTLTWDVLKHVLVGVDYLAELRLTLTWDVLKLVRQFICVSAKEINFNMRCIETDVHASILHFLYRLTLT